MNTTNFSRTSLAILAVVCVLVSACGGVEGESEVVVSAAASLTDAFAEMESTFEEANSGVDVVLNLGGSSALREQILAGAPADVFASANRSNMDQIVAAGEASDRPEVFASNSLQIAVPAGNPAEVTGLEDFADPELLIGLCAPQVPCGDFARQTLDNAGITPAVDTNEPNVRALLTKISTGELDAGITYVTDVVSTEGSVEGIDIPSDVNVEANYLIVELDNTSNPEAAAAFVEYVLSDQGQEILARYGFDAP